MTYPLKYNTASQEVPLGYFLDSTDGDSEETGLTIANTDIKLHKAGATTLANKNSGGATHISNGIYYATLDATDTDTYGPLVLFCHVSGALAVRLECQVMNADAYDALMAANGTGKIEANVTEISGDSGAADNLEADYDGTGYNKSNSTIGTTTTNTDMLSASDIFTAQMAEAYAADGVAPTLAQALFLIQQFLTEAANSGTTRTVKQLDGSTTAATFTYDDASAPTSVTRAT